MRVLSMRFAVPWILTVLLVASAVPFTAGTASACAASPPCGYIFPLITLEPEGGATPRDLPKSGDVSIPVKLTFSFDAGNEGYSVTRPDDKITVTFEFPRKPAWANMSVEPAAIDIPVNDPRYLKPDAADTNNPKLHFEYQTSFTLTLRQVPDGQPVLQDGFETARLLLYAKSNEAKTGLYKAAYAIKEFRVRPEGAIHESDLAPAEGGPVIVDYKPTPVEPLTRDAGLVQFTFKPGAAEVTPWTPFPFTLEATVAGAAAPLTLAYSLVDESGRVAYTSGPRHAPAGTLQAALTVPGVGKHWLLAYAEAPAGSVSPAPSFAAFPVVLEPSRDAKLVAMPAKYKASYGELVTEVSGKPDPTQQYVKWIPFRVEEGATSAQVDITLDTRGAPASPAMGPANLYVQVLNPDGGELAQKSVDFLNPKQTLRIAALPGAGVYHVKVFGFGAGLAGVAGAFYSVDIAANYELPPVAVLQDSPEEARIGDLAFTFSAPADGWQPWTPTPVALAAAAADGTAWSLKGARVSLGVLDPQGGLVYASTPRAVSGVASPDVRVTLMHAGPQFLVAYVAPQVAGGFALQGMPLLLPVVAGATDAAEFTYPASFGFDYEDFAPAGVSQQTPFTQAYAFRILEGAGSDTTAWSLPTAGGSWTFVDASGKDLGNQFPTGPGEYWLIVKSHGPAGQSHAFKADLEYSVAPTEPNPLAKALDVEVPSDEGLFGLPAVGALGVLAVLALVGAAAWRRR